MNKYKMNLQLFGEDEDVILPSDFEETAPPQAEVEETPVAEPVEDTKPTEQPKVKLKYNHEEKEYSLDEVIPLAQKGMNYDKLQEKLSTIENDPRLTKAERLQQIADLYDMDSDSLIDNLLDNYADNLAQEENLTKEQAREKLNKKFDLDKREKLLTQKESEIQRKERETQEYTEFFNNFPEVKADEIPKDVWLYREQTGKTLSDAMLWHQNKAYQEKIKVLEQNIENMKKAPVSGTTTYGDGKAEPVDPFLQGFEAE